MISKRLNNINTLQCVDNELYLVGVDEYGKDFTIVLNAIDVLEWIDIEYIKGQTLKYIDKLWVKDFTYIQKVTIVL